MTDEEIKIVARGMCAELGIDPDEQVQIVCGDDMTPQELSEQGGGGFSISYTMPLWRKYRHQAALAIAAARAVSLLTPDGN